ncbi:replication initiator [Streptomyces sp. NPDC058145]|uniref:replication initiator n=1 Tax=Streptomyces sp. NPDC058145 TaxID=3346356 RepID=UPI0036E7743D
MPETLLDPTTLGEDLLTAASAPDYGRWEDQIRRTEGCADPIHLTGWTLHKDKTTGETLHHYSTANEPGGHLRLACGNRRASRCPACVWTCAGGTYHLIRAGLAGDDRRDIAATVRDHPRVFATLTAPSFGRVHNRPDHGLCRCGTRSTLCPGARSPQSSGGREAVDRHGGDPRATRPRKPCGGRDTRCAEASRPDRILRQHIEDEQLQSAELLFQGESGGILAGSVIRRAWRNARKAVLPPHVFGSPTGRRVYDNRNTRLTKWLDDGIPPAQVAEWAGNRVAVLLATYARCIDGQLPDLKRRLEAAGDLPEPEVPSAG